MRGMLGGKSVAVVAVVVGLGVALPAAAQTTPAAQANLLGRFVVVVPGSIRGIVKDDSGAPIEGATVTALGAMTVHATTDRSGRFEWRSLLPGEYLVRAHLVGYASVLPQIIQVRPSARATSAISLHRLAPPPIVTAGFAAAPVVLPAPIGEAETAGDDETGAPAGPAEIAWRLKHARRGVLQEATTAESLIGDTGPHGNYFGALDSSSTASSVARLAANFVTATPFSGQVNLLTSSSFQSPEQLFGATNVQRGIAFLSLSAPVGTGGDWNVRGALTQADISSWIVAGSYATRNTTNRHYTVGLSYSTQRYEGGNPLALRDVTDGSRNVGELYGFETRPLTPKLTASYGARYARYDYLDDRNLLSPRLELTLTPADNGHLRVTGVVSSREVAPGAEEFLPPSDTGLWLPPQRTFSTLEPGHRFHAERTLHAGIGVERDFGQTTLGVRTFRQTTDDQLVTVFGTQLPFTPLGELGHYFVGNAGDTSAVGGAVAFRTHVTNRFHGSVEYIVADAWLAPSADLRYLLVMTPSAVATRARRIHSVDTTFETIVPETSTKLIVVYRVSDAFAQGSDTSDRWLSPSARFDSRFDVQLRQSLPFMDFASARWEMLVSVRNVFRETAPEQSIYDELLVVRPPKRVVGGLTLHF
jgi:hypothetical protein